MATVPVMIEILDDRVVDIARGLPKRFPAQFNPNNYTRTKSVKWSEIPIPGLPLPITSFVSGQPETLSFDLFFDTTEHGMGAVSEDVRLRTTPFHELAREQPTTHAPPKIRVVWGVGLIFNAVVESVSEKFTLFSPAGTPLRAELSLRMKRYATLSDQLSLLNLQSADHDKIHYVKAGETLSSIAAAEYGNPKLWRVIADENASVIQDPFNLAPGMQILLPKLDEMDAG